MAERRRSSRTRQALTRAVIASDDRGPRYEWAAGQLHSKRIRDAPGRVIGLVHAFLAKLRAMCPGHSYGSFGGRRYGVTIERSRDGRRHKLYAEELGGGDRVSFNLYMLGDDTPLLRPCEMPARKVIDFVLGFRPETDD